jgi:hypothetical protein
LSYNWKTPALLFKNPWSLSSPLVEPSTTMTTIPQFPDRIPPARPAHQIPDGHAAVSSKFCVQVLSDLHLNEWRPRELYNVDAGDIPDADILFQPTAPYLAVLGDVTEAREMMTYMNFLRHCATRWRRVFLVAGNHEAYGSSVPALYESLRVMASAFPNVHLVQDSSVTLTLDRRGDELAVEDTLRAADCECGAKLFHEYVAQHGGPPPATYIPPSSAYLGLARVRGCVTPIVPSCARPHLGWGPEIPAAGSPSAWVL